jgi:7-cyano-7-deazaguanine synthase
MKKAFVLHSGGLDSSVVLYHAIASGVYSEVESVSVDYGQRHKKEIEYATNLAIRSAVKHTILELSDILGGSMLTDASQEIPDATYDELVGVSPTFVPFRNGLLLSMGQHVRSAWGR